MGTPQSLLDAANFISNHQDVFQRRFNAHFHIDLALPFSGTQADRVLNLMETDPGKAEELLRKHIKQIKKWDI